MEACRTDVVAHLLD